jgi:TolA-binding protein
MSIELISIVISGVAAAATSGMFQAFFENKAKKKETLEDRVNKLTAALKESSQLVTEVEEEIQSRQQLVSELQKDAEKYQKLISINQEQVEAVAQLLQGELRKEGNKSFWKGVIANFIFFIMGAGLSWYLSKGF